MTREEIINKIDTIKKAISNLQSQVDDYYNKEQAIKLILNSIYGAIGNPHMVFFNPYVAEAVTAQGKEIILYSEKIMNHYFMNLWHTDIKLHEKLGLIVSGQIKNTVVKYVDTDSVNSLSICNIDNNKNSIENHFNKLSESNDIIYDLRNNEIIDLQNKNIYIKNFKDNQIINSPIKKLIRHKVTKPKWKIKTKSGKEVIVTNDHSIIVFRNGNQLSIKPCEINVKIDKILSVV